MKTLKTLTFTLAILLFAGVMSVDAQQRGQGRNAGPQGAGILTAEMTEALQLTDQQRLQILDLRNANMVQRQQMRDTFREGDTTPNEMQAKREEMWQEHQTQLQQILTEEQYARLLVMREDRRELNRSQRPNNPRGAGMMQGRGNRGGQGLMQGSGNRPVQGQGLQQGGMNRPGSDTLQRGNRTPRGQ